MKKYICKCICMIAPIVLTGFIFYIFLSHTVGAPGKTTFEGGLYLGGVTANFKAEYDNTSEYIEVT